jgi:cell division protein FtsB
MRGGFRWIWAGLALWLLWAGLVSDHSFYRIWRLGRENERYQLELERVRHEIDRLEAELRSPQAMRERAERQLREENGMAKPGEIIYRIFGGPRDSLAR